MLSARELAARIGQRGVALFLDYDGTLTPIVRRPEESAAAVRDARSCCATYPSNAPRPSSAGEIGSTWKGWWVWMICSMRAATDSTSTGRAVLRCSTRRRRRRCPNCRRQSGKSWSGFAASPASMWNGNDSALPCTTARSLTRRFRELRSVCARCTRSTRRCAR